ncbi:25053_t:CDS:1, partial [Gigaspora rosea]
YADDLTRGISSQSDWLDLLEIIKTHEAASNAKVNRPKTMLIPLTVMAQGYNLTSECNFRKATKNEPISILGYKVDSKENSIKHL